MFKRPLIVLTSLVLSMAALVLRQNNETVAQSTTYGIAPELHDSVWLNSDHAYKMTDLRGKVVLIEMWTFDCINCIHTLPYLEQWHQTYRDQGLVVIGNHYPEFDYERDLSNLKAAITRLEITYPVLQDNQRATWDAYNNRYWPTIYLIDKQGNIRYLHIGEGNYAVTEQTFQALLQEEYIPPTESVTLTSSLQAIDVLNVRKGPGIDQALLGSISPDETYAILAEQDGYVASDYVTVTVPLVDAVDSISG